MSRLSSKNNKYDSDKEIKLNMEKVENYNFDDAFKEYVPSEKPKKKKKKGLKILLILLLIFFLIIAVAAGAFFVLQLKGKQMVSYDDATIQAVDQAEVENDGKTVYYNGKKYRLNENITSIACLGIDKEDLGTRGDVIGTGGQSDTNMVLAIDTAKGKVSVIAIPRDIMVDIDLYTVDGEYVGSGREQLCLAYAYGDGKHTSCKNAVASIQRVLFGIPVNSYISLDIAGVGPLNDSVGGVTVVPNETLEGFVAGQAVTLYGERAVNFVQERSFDTNASLRRMERQVTYIKAFASKAIKTAVKDFSVISKLYKTANRFSCTNVGLDNVTYLATVLMSKGVSEINTYSVPGEMKMGDKYAEFYMDTTAAYEMILEVFYDEVQ